MSDWIECEYKLTNVSGKITGTEDDGAGWVQIRHDNASGREKYPYTITMPGSREVYLSKTDIQNLQLLCAVLLESEEEEDEDRRYHP